MNRDEVVSIVLRKTSESISQLGIIGSRKILLNDTFVDLGANSIDRIEIVLEILDALSLDIAITDDIFNRPSIGELADMIYFEYAKSFTANVLLNLTPTDVY